MEKAEGAFLTISELATELGLAQHILRYWETRFPQLRPLQRSGNRRYYRPADVALARRINQDVNTVLAMADVQEKFQGFGVEDGGGSVERYGDFVRTELAKWARVARDAKVTIDS